MPRKRFIPPCELSHRWYLAEWAARLGKRQADATREIGWEKPTASYLWNGKQRYTQNLVDEAARWLQIEPFELLMHPDEAMALRGVRKWALEIAKTALEEESGQIRP